MIYPNETRSQLTKLPYRGFKMETEHLKNPSHTEKQRIGDKINYEIFTYSG